MHNYGLPIGHKGDGGVPHSRGRHLENDNRVTEGLGAGDPEGPRVPRVLQEGAVAQG